MARPAKKLKPKPKPEELKRYETDVKYRGKDYGLSVSDKVADDGVTEAHFKYEPHFRPKGERLTGPTRVGVCACVPGKRVCHFHKNTVMGRKMYRYEKARRKNATR